MKTFYIKYRLVYDFRQAKPKFQPSSKYNTGSPGSPILFKSWDYQLAYADTAVEKQHYIDEFKTKYHQAVTKGTYMRVEAFAVDLPPYSWLVKHLDVLEEEVANKIKQIDFLKREALRARLAQE